MENKYYVYLLLDPRYENRPFYVGKGCGDRARRHLAEDTKNKDNIRKFRKIKKIREAGFEPLIEYYKTDLLESDAYDLELELIKKYGREKIDNNGILTNIAMENKPPVRFGEMSAKQKLAIGAGNRGKKRTPAQSAYLSSIRKGKKRNPCSEETKEKIKISNILKRNGSVPNYPKDLTGLTFGLWKVLSKGNIRNNWRGTVSIYWLCQCDCPKKTIREVSQRFLVNGRSKGCGVCVRRSKQNKYDCLDSLASEE